MSMNRFPMMVRLALMAGVVVFSFSSSAQAQEVRRRTLVPAPVPGNAAQTTVSPSPLLERNYRLTFSGKLGEEGLGELSALTCARQVELNGPLDDGEWAAQFGINGMLEEKEGTLLFTYQISFTAPTKVVKPAVVPMPGNAAPVPGSGNVRFQQHSSSGALRMLPGRTYEVLKVGGAVYTVSIRAEEDEAKK